MEEVTHLNEYRANLGPQAKIIHFPLDRVLPPPTDGVKTEDAQMIQLTNLSEYRRRDWHAEIVATMIKVYYS